jgi:hypothetical protein
MSEPRPPSPSPGLPAPARWLLLLSLALAGATGCGGDGAVDPPAAQPDAGPGPSGGPDAGPGDAGPLDDGTDTDKDGLTDMEEQRLGTSPTVADSDGDGFTDKREVNELGFDPATNNFLFNPRIADVPKVKLRLTSMPNFYLNYQSSLGGSRSFTTAYSDSSTTGTTRSWGGSQTQAIEMTHTAGVSVDVQHEFGLTGGTSIGVSLSYEFSHSTRNETSTNWSQEQRQEQTHTLEEAETRETNETRTFLGGNLNTTVEVENEGNVAFRVEGLTLSAYVHNPENPLALRPLQNLTFGSGDFPAVTLSPGGKRGPLNFSAALDEPTITGLLRDSRNLVISPATYTLTGPNGEDLQLEETNIAARTAHVIIDYGLERPQEVYRVATIRDRNDPGLTVGELLRDVLRLPYTLSTFPWRFPDGTRESFTGLTRLRDVAASDATSSYWIVAHSYKTEGGASSETDYHNLLLAPYALDTLKLQKGDVLHLVYVQDQDRDGLGDRSELVYGTDPNDPDSDDDTCGDSLEVGGWVITEGSVQKRVRPNPNDPDTDDDGATDCDEYHADPRTNPLDRPQNQKPVVGSVTKSGAGMDATLAIAFSDPDLGDRVASVRITWGDGAVQTLPVAAGATTLNASHTYATTGTYSAQVVALDTHGAESAAFPVSVVITMPTSGLLAHFRFEDNVVDSHGTYDTGSYSYARYAAGRTAAAGRAMDPRENNQTFGLFSAPHIPFSGSFTLAAWVSASSVNGSERILGQGDWWTLAFDGSSSVSFSRMSGTSPDSATQVKASGHPANTWAFYAATVAGNTTTNQSVITLYRNGTQVATRTVTGVFLNPGTCRLYVGGYGASGNGCTDTNAPNYNTGGGLNGLVDDLRVYSRALSAAEVSILASENKP